MKPVRSILAVLLAAYCFACTLEARAASLATPSITPFEREDPGDSQRSDKALRAQLRRPAPTQPTQVQIELVVERDPPFESGKPIQFAVRAEPWRQDLEYRYFFGDGPPTGWLSDSRYPHSYISPGIYPVYVEVRSKPALFAFADSWRSNVVRVQVVQKEAPISVNLETLDSPPFRVGEPLRFAARTEGTGLRLEYQFLFGDGRATTWTRESVVRHAYTEAGTYQAVVFVREQSLEGQGGHSGPVNSRAMLRVVIEPDATGDSQQAVKLVAYPTEVQAGAPVRLEAHVEPEIGGAVFVFDFGDEQQSEPLHDNTAAHRYANPGTYVTFVRVYKEDRLVGKSRSVNVTVTPGITHRLILEADKTNPGTMERVWFTWNVEPPAAGVLYHIDFGDNNNGWMSETRAEHAYRESGDYRAVLKARIGGRDIQSNELVVTVRKTIRPWLYVLLAIALGVAGAGIFVWRIIARARNRKGGKAMKAGPIDTAIVMRPHKDPGIRQLEFSTRVEAGLDVRFQPVLHIGEQVMERGISARKRKEENHG